MLKDCHPIRLSAAAFCSFRSYRRTMPDFCPLASARPSDRRQCPGLAPFAAILRERMPSRRVAKDGKNSGERRAPSRQLIYIRHMTASDSLCRRQNFEAADNPVGCVRLVEKVTALRQGSCLTWRVARYDQNTNWRPAFMDDCGKLKPIHGARHIDVREHNTNIVAAFEQGHGFVGGVCENTFNPGVLHDITRHDHLQRVVLDNENDCLFGHSSLAFSLNLNSRRSPSLSPGIIRIPRVSGMIARHEANRLLA